MAVPVPKGTGKRTGEETTTQLQAVLPAQGRSEHSPGLIEETASYVITKHYQFPSFTTYFTTNYYKINVLNFSWLRLFKFPLPQAPFLELSR